MNRSGYRIIGYGSRRCLDIGDKVGTLVVTGFGDVHSVTGPGRCPLGCISYGCVVGRTDVATGPRKIVIVPVDHLSFVHGVVLDPNLAQDLDGWQIAQFRWCVVGMTFPPKYDPV